MYYVKLALHPRAYGARSHLSSTALHSRAYDPLRLLAVSSELPDGAHAPIALGPLRVPNCQFGRAERKPAGSSGAR